MTADLQTALRAMSLEDRVSLLNWCARLVHPWGAPVRERDCVTARRYGNGRVAVMVLYEGVGRGYHFVTNPPDRCPRIPPNERVDIPRVTIEKLENILAGGNKYATLQEAMEAADKSLRELEGVEFLENAPEPPTIGRTELLMGEPE